ncbi:MAG: DPP IV N-terminal domain-containing protein, partial [Bacteroidia bacterium]
MKKILLFAVGCSLTLATSAQQGKTFTAKDYEHAEKFMSYHTEPYIDRGSIRPNWLSDDKFWYQAISTSGTEFILVDSKNKSKILAFDHQKMANALSLASGESYDAKKLPVTAINYSTDGKSISVTVEGKRWKVEVPSYNTSIDTSTPPAAVKNIPQGRGGRGEATGITPETLSPDGKRAVYIKDHNLWVRDLAINERKQLTRDGVKDYGYATDNAGWKSSEKAIVRWSPDSKKIATFQQDQRMSSDMYLITTNVGAPVLKAWKYPLPGDKEIPTIRRIIIDIETGAVVNLQIPPDPHRATLSDDISSSGTLDDIDWKADGSEMAFLSTSRDHKHEKFRIADATTGVVREVFDEVVKTQFESGRGAINWRYLPNSNEILWYSERDNWGHMYLYDATTGKLKNQITKGDWVVTRLLKVDEKKRQLLFLACGREPGNPYFAHLYKIGFDGKNLVSLTPEDGNHQITFSPSENYFIDTYSQPDVPPVMNFRNITGKLIFELEKTDVSRLKAIGWKAPTVVSVKAHDTKTDIFGLVFTPTTMDPQKKYPVIDYIYPGPQGGSVGNWSFNASRSDHQALAELGFIVVVIEGTSNPFRSKSYHDMSYGNMAENTLPDQITAIRQLSRQFPIDTNKVGIWGHSGGGFATAAALLRYPDFFKV